MSSAADCVGVEIDGHVATIVFDRPPVNSWNKDMTEGLSTALDRIEDDRSIRVVLICGRGKAFSAGSDVHEFAQLLDPGEAVEQKLRPQHEVFARLADLPKPTVAVLTGYTLGGGLEIAVCCDLIVAEEHVQIGSPEITLGVFPSSGGTFRVARRIGVGRAKYMQFTGRPIDAATALSWGLVNEIAPTGRGQDVADALVATLLRRPLLAIGLCKSVLNVASDLDDRELIQRSLDASERAFTSPEAAEGTQAFMEKRTADFIDLDLDLDTKEQRT